jgi:hypothetical protein
MRATGHLDDAGHIAKGASVMRRLGQLHVVAKAPHGAFIKATGVCDVVLQIATVLPVPDSRYSTALRNRLIKGSETTKVCLQ